MKKQISLGENDRELVEKISEYQKENGIKSFTEAVRRLCKCGLEGNVHVKIDLKNK